VPIYEYACEAHHTWESLQSVREEPTKTCPTCGAPARRLISTSSFRLVGDGWAADLYGKGTKTP
jgi:putative FmdB family regulatory protein